MEDKKIKQQKLENSQAEKPVLVSRKLRLSSALRKNLQRRKSKEEAEK